MTRITLKTDPSKNATPSVEHWDPHGKYTFKKLGKKLYKKKRRSVKDDTKEDTMITLEQTSASAVVDLRSKKTVAVENISI